MKLLQDNFERRFSYLRLSLTSVCNFRCQYCLPNGNQTKAVAKDLLTVQEIACLVKALSELGITKIRLTGGEPTLRKELCEIARLISSIGGITKLALSTNGFCLEDEVANYYDAGIHALNISVDSLKVDNFLRITGQDKLSKILRGIHKALDLGIAPLKVNTVLLRNLNDAEVWDFVEWVRDKSVTLRFIELMPTGDNVLYFNKHYLSPDFIREKLLKLGWSERLRENTAGPARTYMHPDYQGAVGFIQPYSKNFCDSCNRLRVTSFGELRMCLFGNGNTSLRHLLQSPSQKEELKELICALLMGKTESHLLKEGNYGSTRNLAEMGG